MTLPWTFRFGHLEVHNRLKYPTFSKSAEYNFDLEGYLSLQHGNGRIIVINSLELPQSLIYGPLVSS